MIAGFLAGLFTLIALLFGSGGGTQNQQQQQSNQKTQSPPQQQVFVAKPPAGNASEPPTGQQVTSIPTPALLPGLLGLGAAVIRKRKAMVIETEH